MGPEIYYSQIAATTCLSFRVRARARVCVCVCVYINLTINQYNF